MNLTENARMCTFLLVKVDIVHNKGLIVVIPMKPCYNREASSLPIIFHII